MFLLCLHWGADPNVLDENGDSALLSLIKTDPGYKSIDFLRLLLSFGADPTLQDRLNGNTALHVLASDPTTNLFVAFYVYQSGPDAASIRNKIGYTPYTVHTLETIPTSSLFLQ